MGGTQSKRCTSCQKLLKKQQKIDSCSTCQRFVCSICSTRERLEESLAKSKAKERVCHVCKVCKTEQECDDHMDMLCQVGKPLDCKRMLSISYENGQFSGLPKQWRETLGLSRMDSHREVDINKWDHIIGGGSPDTQKM